MPTQSGLELGSPGVKPFVYLHPSLAKQYFYCSKKCAFWREPEAVLRMGSCFKELPATSSADCPSHSQQFRILLPRCIQNVQLRLELGMNVTAFTWCQGSVLLSVKWDNLVSHSHVLEQKSLFAVSTEYLRWQYKLLIINAYRFLS